MNQRVSIHNHTYFSNLRLLDALSSPEALIDKAIELGLAGIGISDHESLSSHVRVNKYAQKIKEDYPDFKVILGNEIYLTKTRDSGQKYYHFLLAAKDEIGHKTMRELSSIAWLNSYFDRGLQRVPTLYDELKEIVLKYGKGHLIASSACIGSNLGQNILKMREADIIGDIISRKEAHDDIVNHVLFCQDLFGDDFYFEIAPALYEEQIYVNQKTYELSKIFGTKVTVQDDSHRITQEDYIAHKALLNSKQGEREDIDSFYQYTYLQSYEDIRKHLAPTNLDCDELFANSMEIYNKVEEYSLLHNQKVVQVAVQDFPKKEKTELDKEKYPVLNSLYNSDNIQERNWVNQCINKLKEKNIFNDLYLAELEYEADIQKVVGEKLGTCLFAYPLFLQHYIDLFWECGSPVGVARGSGAAGLNHYLLGITQLDPLKEGFKYWRFLNKERLELPDIDIDTAPDRKQAVFSKIREERGPLGLVQICTFGTLSSRASVQSACRGYRSAEYPNGIDVDEAQYLTSLIGSERGFVWSIHDTVYGNPDKNRKPVKNFVNAVSKYPGLLDIILKLEGCISHRGIHASGVLFLDKGHEYDINALMMAPDGSITTQYDLHDAESTGNVKYDFLYTDVESKIAQCLQLLQEHGKIEKDLTLREAYNKYLHPDVLPMEEDKLWDAIDKANIPSLFQLTSMVGSQTVKKLRPRNIKTLNDVNGIMRLMADDSGESPTDRYARLQNNPQQWEDEMNYYNLTQEEKNVIREYVNNGVLIDQETLMRILMDERICSFSLKESNAARKIVAKKQMNQIEKLHQQILNKATSEAMGKYLWFLLAPSMGYSFSSIHGTSYSYIAVQCAYLATYFPSIYWNTACVRVDAGLGLDDTTAYEKIARALGNIKEQGIGISTIDINKSGMSFEPDEKNNTIIYGLKALNGVGGEITQQIIDNRPYTSVDNFKEKVKVNKTVMISLIKSGAFDEFGPRDKIMRDYLYITCGPKKRITLQNFKGLMDRNLIPQEFEFQKRLFVFNKALKANCKIGDMYGINFNYYDFYEEFFDTSLLEPLGQGLGIPQKTWDKLYKNGMDPVRDYFKANQQEILDLFNNTLLQEEWDKYAQGTLSTWEMDSLSFYSHEHELSHIDNSRYNIVNYNSLKREPEIEYMFKRNGHDIPIYKTFRIAGTVIAKNSTKSIVTILTTDNNVVDVKFTRDYFAKYNKRISEIGSDGKKHIIEKGFFDKGTLVIINGFRRGDMFVSKKYSRTKSHQLYKIIKINQDGSLEITNDRAGEE